MATLRTREEVLVAAAAAGQETMITSAVTSCVTCAAEGRGVSSATLTKVTKAPRR